MTRIKTVRMALVAALTFALLGLGGAALAQDEADRDYWVHRYETLVKEVEMLRTRADVLATNYRKARQRNYPRGAELYALEEERNKARAELAEKEQELEDFPDEARRAGALPGWFRDLDGY